MARIKRRVKPTLRKTRKSRKGHELTAVHLWLRLSTVEKLDKLCAVNARARATIIDTLVHEAHIELRHDKTARIEPLP